MRYRFKIKKNISLSSQASDSVDVELINSYKQFSKKPVTQVETVPEFRIIITLSDGLIHINNLDDLSVYQVLHKTRGATCFATNLKPQTTLTNEVQYMLRLCVVVKKKIILLYWKNKNFHEMSREFNVEDPPKSIAWCDESLFLGYRSQYDLIKLSGGPDEAKKNLSATGGKQPEPTITLLQDDKVSINRDENSYILDQDGEPYLNYPIGWTDIPTSIAEDYPYLLALLPSSIIEVRTIKPHLFIQRLELAQETSNFSKIKLLTKCAGRKGLLIVASASDIFAIVAISLDQQRMQMVSEKHFELALKLAKMELHQEEDSPIIRDIELQYAHDLFHRECYRQALELFLKLDISPLIVIDLFPDLSDDAFTRENSSNSAASVRSGPKSTSSIASRANSENGQQPGEERLVSLIDYLIQIRRKINAGSSKQTTLTSSVSASNLLRQQQMQALDQALSASSSGYREDDFSLFSHLKSPRALERLKQEIDTCLMKCYLKTKNPLVASLLRLPDNHCKLQVTEKALTKYHKYNELIILYQSRGLHQKALDLLKGLFDDSPMNGYEKMVQYLQNLGQEHLEIIFEYAVLVLEHDPELGLRIFTADLQETEQLDRNLVLEFIRRRAPEMEIPYLEHLIHFWNDKTPQFHTTLLLRYRQKVMPLLAKYIESIGDQVPCPAGQEPGELGQLRQKLLDFLEISDHYSHQNLPALLLNEGLCEERAIVVGKLGQHEEALSIFIYVLNNSKRAEEYCLSVYQKKLPNSKDIFFLLLKLYLHPPETFSSNQLRRKMSVSSASQTSGDSSVPINFNSRIVKLLNEHGDKISPLKAVSELPNDFDLLHLKDYLGATMKRKLQESHEKEMFRQLVMSKFYQVQKTWIQLQQDNKIVIDDSTTCHVCHKKIGLSAFVRFPNFVLVHYSCKDRYSRVGKAQLPSSVDS